MEESGNAAYLQDIGTRVIFIDENFSSIRSVPSSPLDDNKKQKNKNNKNMKQTCLPK